MFQALCQNQILDQDLLVLIKPQIPPAVQCCIERHWCTVRAAPVPQWRMARLGTACVLGSRGLVLSGPLAIWIHSTALRGCPQSVLSAVELRGAGRTPSGNVQAAAYRANRREAGREWGCYSSVFFFFFTPIFSRTINWGPEDSSLQLLFLLLLLRFVWDLMLQAKERQSVYHERKRERESVCEEWTIVGMTLGYLMSHTQIILLQ